MNQPAIAAKPDILDVFEARAEARGYLWREGEFDLPTAVDKLQADAERDGLIARLGQDEIQQILARTFHAPPVAIAAIAPDPVFKQPPRHRAPKCTVDALMFTLRQHGVSALQCGHTRQRITELSDDQIESVVTRLSRLRGTYTKITDDLLLALAELLDG